MNKIIVSGRVKKDAEFFNDGGTLKGRITVVECQEGNEYEVNIEGVVAKEAQMGYIEGSRILVSGQLIGNKDKNVYYIKADYIEILYGKRIVGYWDGMYEKPKGNTKNHRR